MLAVSTEIVVLVVVGAVVLLAVFAWRQRKKPDSGDGSADGGHVHTDASGGGGSSPKHVNDADDSGEGDAGGDPGGGDAGGGDGD